MKTMPRRQLYLIALTLLLVDLLLLVFISISTVRNLNRERDAARQTFHRQALTLITALESGARANVLMQMNGRDVISYLVDEIGRSEAIDYLYLANADGKVLHHSTSSLKGTQAAWIPRFNHGQDVHARVRRLADGTRVYEVVKPFNPMGIRPETGGPPGRNPTGSSNVHVNTQPIVYIGMSMTMYETARRADLQHALIMGGIVLVLGGGVIYFFMVLRGYYRLSRTLQETRDYTRQVVASMAHGVLSIDTHGHVVFSNKPALSLLEIPEAEREHIDLREIFDFEDTGIVKTLEAGTPVLNHEMRFQRRSGGTIPLMLTATPIKDEADDRLGAVVVVRDMSAIKHLEKKVRRAEKLAAVGRLAAGVAHEIRNPLSSIRGFAYLLGKGHGEASPEREYADLMVREIDRISHVVSDLLNFARPMTVEPEDICLADIIDHVVALVSADTKAQGIDMQVHGEPEALRLLADPNQLTQAILNLVLNAIHALDDGGTIRIHADRHAHGEGVAIHVEDNGPGIAPDLHEKIFEPFTTTRERGTGLGLAIVRKIAENHNGGVHVESPPSGKARGTRFTLVLKDVEP